MADLFFDQDAELEDHAGPAAPTGRRPRRRWPVLLLVLLALVLAMALVGFTWVKNRIDPPGGPGEPVAVEIPRGSSTSRIGTLLDDNGVISDAGVWRWYVRLQGAGPFDAGQYAFRRNSSIEEAIKVLEARPALPPAENVTIPEGLTLPEVATAVGRLDRLSPERFTELAQSGTVRSKYQPAEVTSLEGLLLPETYRLEEDEGEDVLLTRMVQALDAAADAAGYADSPAKVGLSPYQTLVVASLIEAEAKVDGDRAKISRVIHNRLVTPGFTLGIDATVYFALGRTDNQGLTASDLEVDSPYNTRKYGGLPPGPICIPGRASIEAAINPEPGPWLYYVLADASGAHAFTDSYDQFLADKAAAEEKGLL